MGEVYRAADDRLGREVAIKILKPEFATSGLRRFELEARAAAGLNHPNIVAIYDVGLHDGAPYIVSELLEGQTLRGRLLSGPIPLRQVSDFARQIVQGLAAAHEKHIVHRDLKPENLFITRDGRVKILDFGIAKLVLPEVDETRSVDQMTTQTKAGAVLGTVAYMSPEQLRARPVDHRSDIFSFGAILYEMLTSKRAFSGETEVDTITAVLKDDPPEINLVRQDLPPAYEQVVRHCLEKNPDDRFQSARDLAFALSTLSEVPTGKMIVPVARGKSAAGKVAQAIGIGLIAVLAALGTWYALMANPAATPEYRRLTFELGTVYSARFTPDEHSVVYSAAWNGAPIQLFSTQAESPLEQPLPLQSAYLMGISRSSELAVSLRAIHGAKLEFTNGTLARAPLAGGSPREVEENVEWAAWDSQGGLAIDHSFGGKHRLEYPIGKVLYETTGAISNPRFAPQDDQIAFLDHPVESDDRGFVCMVDRTGHKTTLTHQWESVSGLAWNPKTGEIWFTAAEGGTNRSLWAATRAGKLRKILSVPLGSTLQDIGQDGRVLITFGNERLAMEIGGREGSAARDLSWYDWTIAKDLSLDGRWVLFEESSEPTGANYAVAIRNVDDSPPVKLGEGSAGSLSPDGKWALAIVNGPPDRIVLLPTGTGQSRTVSPEGIEHIENGLARFLPDGQQIIFSGNEPGHLNRTFVTGLDGGRPRGITPEGISTLVSSPDGRNLAGWGTQPGALNLYPVNGGPVRRIGTLPHGYVPLQWSADGAYLYVVVRGEVPLKIFRFSISSGQLTPFKEITPSERAGVVSIEPLVVSPDGSRFLYSYLQARSDLYVISGLQ